MEKHEIGFYGLSEEYKNTEEFAHILQEAEKRSPGELLETIENLDTSTNDAIRVAGIYAGVLLSKSEKLAIAINQYNHVLE